MNDWPLWKRMKEVFETSQDLTIWVAAWIDEAKALQEELEGYRKHQGIVYIFPRWIRKYLGVPIIAKEHEL